MFDNIHFFTSDVTLINKRNFSMENTEDLPREEYASRSSAFGTLGESDDYNVPGHTAILFPPLNSDFPSAHCILLQGFFLCDHWKGYFTKREHYQSYMLCYTISGEGVLEYEGKRYPLKEQDLFWIDCRNYQYYYAKDAAWQHVDIHFYGGPADDLYRAFRANGGPVCNCPLNAMVLQSLEELAAIWDSNSVYLSLHLSNKLTEILTGILTLSKKERIPERQMDTFSYVVRYMENHFSEQLSLDFLADFASMSKYHFSRGFKNYTGLSPVQYMIHLRLAHAKSMLATSDLSVKEIAFTTGFTDINNFIKQFKRVEHMTPTAYRQFVRMPAPRHCRKM